MFLSGGLEFWGTYDRVCPVMPITKSAKKALRQSIKRKTANNRRKKVMKDAIKSVKVETLAQTYKAIDKAVKAGVLKKSTAARRKSLVARKVAKKT